MRRSIPQLVRAVSVAAILLGLPAPSAGAQPVEGTLNIAGALQVRNVGGSLFVDFLDGGTGAFTIDPLSQTGFFSTLAGTTGAIQDLDFSATPPGVPINQTGFLTFAANPALRFDLTNVPLGVFGSAQCTAPPAAGQVCTPPGTPVSLVNMSASSSSISASAAGNVTSNSVLVSTFNGTFTTQAPSQSYQELLAALSAPGGTVNSTFSASFVVNVVPEPSTFALTLGAGLLLGAATLRRRLRS